MHLFLGKGRQTSVTGVTKYRMTRHNIFYLLILAMILPSDFCKNEPTQPEDVHQYRERVVVSYRREMAITTEASLGKMRIHYRLYDPFAEEPISDENIEERIDGDFRIGSMGLTLFVQNSYFGILKNVFVHTRDDQPEHMVYVVDPMLHPSDVNRWETTRGISVQGAYAYKKRSNRLYFKMSKD